MVRADENPTLFYFQLAKMAFGAGLYGACTIYCACALEAFLRDFAVQYPLDTEKIDIDRNEAFLQLDRKDLLDTAKCHGLVSSSSREKCEQIFLIRNGHAHYHRGLWKKTFRGLKCIGITEVHSIQLAHLVLGETHEILGEMLSQLEKIARTGDSSARFLHERLERALA